MPLEIEKNDAAAAVHRGLLLSTREKQLAKARAETLKLRAQMEKSRVEAQVARQEAQELREHIITNSIKSPNSNLRTIATAFTAVLMTAAVAKITYFGFMRPTSHHHASAATPSAAVHVNTPLPTVRPLRILTHKPPAPGDVQFKLAMTRLQDDLSSFPESESEIVTLVNAKNPPGPRPCPLEWVNGEAALSLDANNERIPPSLLTAVDRCSDAIERFRDKRDALQAHDSTLTGKP